MKTNESTRPPHEVYAQALDFLATTRLVLVGPHRNKRCIWNMDQTPLCFLYHRLKTLAKRGTKMIHVCKTSIDTKRATAALTVLAAGEWLKPKRQPRGQIAWKELKTFNLPEGSVDGRDVYDPLYTPCPQGLSSGKPPPRRGLFRF